MLNNVFKRALSSEKDMDSLKFNAEYFKKRNSENLGNIG